VLDRRRFTEGCQPLVTAGACLLIKDEAYRRGIELRQAIFGDGQEDAVESAGPLTAKLQEIVTRWCCRDTWQRDGLSLSHRQSLRDRGLMTVAM
jgi:hypothetical protein